MTIHMVPRRDQFAAENCRHPLKTNNNSEMQKPSSTWVQDLGHSQGVCFFVSALDGGTVWIQSLSNPESLGL